jgi:hypothetical protein
MEHFAKSLIYTDHNFARSPPLNRGLACCSLLESVTPASWVAASAHLKGPTAGVGDPGPVPALSVQDCEWPDFGALQRKY